MVGISGTSISTGTDGTTSIGGKNSTTASFSTDSSGNTTYVPAGMTATEAQSQSSSDSSSSDNDSDYGHDDRGFAFTKDVSNPRNAETFSQSKSRYNAQGVDENGLTMSGKAGDRNGDGKISFGEAIANNLSNLGQRANMAFGGADSFGRTSQGRTADRNGDGRISFGERIGNMFSNFGASVNQTFGGVNYAGENKAGEQVVAPGGHVTFGQRVTNIGHNLATKGGATWNDENNNGIIDNGELGKALAGRMATGLLGLVPTVGKTLSSFVQGAMGGKTNNFAGQLGRSATENNNGASLGSLNNSITPSTGEIKKKEEEKILPSTEEDSIKKFMTRAKKVNLTLPTNTSTFIKKATDKKDSVTVSDEDIKRFAVNFAKKVKTNY